MSIKKSTMLFLIVMSVIIPSICFANNLSDQNIIDIFNKRNIELKEEKNNLKMNFDSYKEQYKYALNIEDFNIDTENLQKIYQFINPDIVKGFKEKGTLKELISKDYNWHITSMNKNNEKKINIVLKKLEESKEWIAIGMSDVSEHRNIINVMDDNVIKYILKESEFDKVSNIQYIKSHMYRTTFFYFVSNHKEYVIPYGTRPDLTGLKNGKIYEVENAISILEKMFSNVNRATDFTGANTMHNTQKSNYIFFAIIAIIIFGALFKSKKLSTSKNKN